MLGVLWTLLVSVLLTVRVARAATIEEAWFPLLCKRGRGTMSSVPSRLRVGLAWTVPAVCVTLLVVFALLSYGSPAWGTEINSAALELIPLSIGFSCLGALIVAHRRGNRLGWLYLFIGTASAFTLFCFMYAQHGLIDAPGSLPAAVFAGWVSGWVWAVGGVSAFSSGCCVPGRSAAVAAVALGRGSRGGEHRVARREPGPPPRPAAQSPRE